MTSEITREPTRIPTVILGVALVGAGVAWLLDATDAADVSWRLVLPCVLIGIGIALVIQSASPGGHGGLVPAGVVITVLLAFSWALPGDLSDTLSGGVGDRTEAPTGGGDLESSYRLGIGELTVDLRDTEFESGTTRIDVRVGIGELRVLVPAGIPVRARGQCAIGDVDLIDCESSGLGAERECRSDGYGVADQRISLDLEVGLGAIEVTN